MEHKRYTVADARTLATALGHPAMVLRDGTIVAVNAAALAEFDLVETQIEGRLLGELLPLSDRHRILGLLRAAQAGKAPKGLVTTLGRSGAGAAIRVHAHPTVLEAADFDGQYLLVTMLTTPERPFEVARTLFEVASSFATAGSEAEVRARAVEGFHRAGFTAETARLEDDWSQKPGLLVERARDALEGRRPIFDGADSAPSRVYLPMSDPGLGEVLVVGGPLDVTDTFVLSLFAELASAALAEARRSAAALDKLRGTQILLDLSRTTASSLDLDEVLEITADSLVPLLGVSGCFVLLYDEAGGCLRSAASSAAHRERFRGVAIRLDDETSIASQAARQKRPVLIGDTALDERARKSRFVGQFNETAVAAFPMTPRGRLEGVLVFDETRGPRHFEADWVEFASAMVSQVGLSIANARLYDSLKQSYDELEATRAAMLKRERLAALGELAAIVAHEVRNPLGVMVNATTSLRRTRASAPEADILLDILDEECARLNTIVSDLIDFARPRELSLEPEDVGKVIGEAIRTVRAQPQSPEDVAFEAVVDGDLPPLAMDRRLIRQALTNVAMNASQAMPRGGTVRIRAARADGSVVIAVEDRGAGIDPEVLPHIFQPFFTTKGQGSGLGLAVVKRIVEDHRGRVEVTSTDAGTTFSLVLPILG